MKKTLSMILAAAMAMLLSCCTSDELLVADATEGIASEGASVITFTAGVGTTTRADSDDELQTETEKTVTSLYAVLFASSSVTTSGETDTETGKETLVGYYAVEGISSNSALSSSTTYTLTIDDADDDSTTGYQLCFVANVSASLLSGLTEETSTVSDLKALVVNQEPESPFVMTSSSFYGIKKGETTTLTSVSLKRIVARIDIQNCGGVIITKATMKNRAVKSVLINDNSTTTTSDYLETSDAEYTISEGSQSDATSDAPVYVSQSEIYSYEQLCSDDSAPVITLTYKFSSSATDEQTVDVEFETSDGSALYIQRNHYYLIKVSASEEEEPALEFELSVADWDDGETFTVANSTFTSISDQYAGVSVGDFIMNDGSLLKVSTDDSSNTTTFSTVGGESVTTSDFSDSYYPIAVVFYVLDDDDDSEDTDSGSASSSSAKSLTRSMSASDRFGIEAYKALGGAVHGKALALKNAASQSNWAEGVYATTETGVLTLGYEIAASYADYDGYGNTQAILDLVTDSNTFPDFTYAVNHTPEAPEASTGWYLPAIGEWYDIIENLADYDLSKYKDGTTTSTSTNSYGKYYSISDGATVADALNAKMKLAGDDYYDAIQYGSNSNRNYFTTSTETNAKGCRNIGFDASSKLKIDAYLKGADDSTQRVRSVFAF